MVISRIASGLVSSGRVFGCNHQILSVRTHWWGHETLEDQEAALRDKKKKDVIAWSKPDQNLAQKKEYIWAPNRIKEEAALANSVSVFSKWTGTTDVLAYTSKFSPSWYNFLFKPDRWLDERVKKKYGYLVKSQAFFQERLQILGPDLSAAHFLCHANCRVRFRGHKEWTELNEKGELDIPATYVKGWYIEAIDAATAKLVYEGLQNLRNLHHIKYLDISYCEYIDEWCMDRLSGEYADTLEYLNISGCRKIEWNGLEIVWRFKNLKTLVLKDMDHIENLPLICLMLLDILPKLKIVGAEYMDLKMLEGTEHQYLLDENFIPDLPKLESSEGNADANNIKEDARSNG